MSDFGSSIYRLKPGLKSYLFLTPHANVLDELLKRSIKEGYINRLSPSFLKSDLESYYGVGDIQSTIIDGIDQLSEAQWSWIDQLLSKPKVPNSSLFLLGNPPSLAQFQSVRSRVSKQGLILDDSSPNTHLSQKNFVAWVADECKIHIIDARSLCESLDWSISKILWSMRYYISVSSGLSLPQHQSRILLNMSVGINGPYDAFCLLKKKKTLEAAEIAQDFNVIQTKEMVDRLEQFLTEVSLISDPVKAQMSDKKVSAETGLSVPTVVELKPYLGRYQSSSLAKCFSIIKFARENIESFRLARTVALLWAQ